MPWIIPDSEILEANILSSRAILQKNLWGADCLLYGGALTADSIRLTSEERSNYFHIHLNHHLTRRNQLPCDWLIARAGSGMSIERIKSLNQFSQIKVLSTACNKHFFPDFSITRPTFAFHECGYVKANPFHFSLEWCNQFWNEINTNPLIGILAIKMILMFPIRSLTLRGFDFFAIPDSGGQRKKLGCHNLAIQREWLRQQYKTDFRLILDDKLKAILAVEDNERGLVVPFEE